MDRTQNRGFKKPATQLSDRAARVFFDSLSKAALIDLYVDALRIMNGDERLDGADLIKAARETNLEAVLVARGDKIPK